MESKGPVMWDFYLAFLLHAVNIAVFIWKYRKLSTPLKVIGYTILINLAFDIYSASLALKGINNLFLLHAQTIVNFTTIGIFFTLIFRSRFMMLYWVLFPFFLAFGLYNMVRLNTSTHFPTYTLIIKNAVFIMLCLGYHASLLSKPVPVHIYRHPYFMVTFGLLLASMGSFFIEGLMNQLLQQSREHALKFYLTGAMLNYIYYVSVAISFLVYSAKQDYPSLKNFENESG